MSMLYQLGGVSFMVAPVNIHETEMQWGGDYAAKDIIGAHRPREFTGQADTTLNFSCRLFPQKFGGLSGLVMLQMMAAAGIPQMLIRGDGAVFGFFIIDRVQDKQAYLDMGGVGRMIEVEINLIYSPVGPSVGSMVSMLGSLF